MRNKNNPNVDLLDPLEAIDDNYPLEQDDEIAELFFDGRQHHRYNYSEDEGQYE